MRILRTPEERFQAFARDPLTPRYGKIDSGGGPSLRNHYVNEGLRVGEFVLEFMRANPLTH